MHNLIAHALVRNSENQFLITRRSMIKRGKENYEGGKWDIPGGTVEALEFPASAAQREVKEEVNLEVAIENVIFEKSNLDTQKNQVFTTLVYSCKVVGNLEMLALDKEEHDAYRWVSKEEILAMKEDYLVSYMKEFMERCF